MPVLRHSDQDATPDHCDLSEHERSALPVTGVAVDYPVAHDVASHRHRRCQLLYAVEGILQVEAATGRWMVPPTMAVWLRPEVDHRLILRGPVRIRSLLVEPDAASTLPMDDCVIHVSPLLRELVMEVAQLGLEIGQTSRGRLLSALLLEELISPPALPFHLPWPADVRIGAVCRALADDPAHTWQASQWADSLAMSSKTFQRHFQKHAGMPFSRWRQQLRLLSSMEALLAGTPILQVALQCGYESHSAFTLAFKAHFGKPPSAFTVLGHP